MSGSQLVTTVSDAPARAIAAAEEARVRAAYARRDQGERYAYGNAAHLFMMQERERAVLALLARTGLLPLAEHRILDVGCGGGQWLQDLVRWGASPDRIAGLELLTDRLDQARRTTAADISLVQGGASALPWPDASFDLVLQATVFSSLLDARVRRAVAGEMLRVLRPGGAVLWYDFRVNNPRNPDVRRVGRREIERLFAGCEATLVRVTLAPPVTRLFAAHARPVASALALVPWLRTHYLGVMRKP